MNKLDFVIVGAQKCATTTLHQYLSAHPDIDMPPGKEAPLFNQSNKVDDRAMNNFMMENFSGAARENVIRGKASPQYMSDTAIAQKIFDHNPDTKIIAILRDPRKRAFSHYRMALRRGTENRSFADAISVGLETANLSRGRRETAPMHSQGYESEENFYIPWGEYGRILEEYVRVFGRDRILVLFTESLNKQPEADVVSNLLFFGSGKCGQNRSGGTAFSQRRWSPNY